MKLSDFRGRHDGEKMLVIGCGPSSETPTNTSGQPYRIGVNDAHGYWDHNYLVIVDTRKSFDGARWDRVEDRAFWTWGVFTRIALKHFTDWLYDVRVPTVFKTNWTAKLMRDGKDYLPLGMSPMAAIALAAYMGSKQIGVLGVDHVPCEGENKDKWYFQDDAIPKIEDKYLKLVRGFAREEEWEE